MMSEGDICMPLRPSTPSVGGTIIETERRLWVAQDLFVRRALPITKNQVTKVA
jgi:hypothetical protein